MNYQCVTLHVICTPHLVENEHLFNLLVIFCTISCSVTKLDMVVQMYV